MSLNEELPSDRFDLHKHPAIWAFAAFWIIAALHLWTVGQWRSGAAR